MANELELLYNEIKESRDKTEQLYNYLKKEGQEESYQVYRLWGMLTAYEEYLMQIERKIKYDK